MSNEVGKITKYLVAPTTYNVSNDVDVIEVNTSSGGATTIYLQAITIGSPRKPVYINDNSGNASVGNIIVIATGGNKINNAVSITLDSDGISAQVVIADRNRFIANLNSDSPSPPSASTLKQVMMVGNSVGLLGITNDDATATLDITQTGVAILYSNVGSASAPRLTLDQSLGLARMSSVNGEISLDPTRNFFTHVAVNEFDAPVHYFSTGNVGIGTNTPTEILHVVGNAIIDGKLSVTGIIDPTQIQFSGVGIPDEVKYEVGFSGTQMYYNVPVGSTHDFRVGGVSKMSINASGYLELNGDPITPLGAVTKQYADGLVVGLLDDRGNWDASVNLYPNTNGSGTAGAILKGDIWYISVAGTLGVNPVLVGYSVRALVDAPAQVDANWDILNVGLGYVPENVLNKATTFGVLNNTLYPTILAVSNYVTSQGYLTSVSLTTNVTGILPVANGGTNSSVALTNSKVMVSVGGAIVENPNGNLFTSHVVVTGSTNNFPKTNTAFRWNDTANSLGVGTTGTAGDRVSITSTGAMRGMFITSAVIGAVISTNASGSVALGLENASGSVLPNSIVSYTKSSGGATIGQGLYEEWVLQVPTSAVVNKFGVVTTDITAGTYKTKFVWQTPNEIDGTIIDRMSLSSRGVLEIYHPVGTIFNEGFLSGSTADSNDVTATAVETNFTTNSTTFVVPENSLQVGSRIRVSFKGRFSTSAVAQTLTFRLKRGAVVILATAPRTMVLGAVNRGLYGDVIMRVVSIGVGGTIMAGMNILYQETNAFSDGYITPNITNKAFNTTIANTLQFSAQWSTGNVANHIILEDVYFEILKPQ